MIIPGRFASVGDLSFYAALILNDIFLCQQAFCMSVMFNLRLACFFQDMPVIWIGTALEFD